MKKLLALFLFLGVTGNLRADCISECVAECGLGGGSSKATAPTCTQAEKEASAEAEKTCANLGGVRSLYCTQTKK